MTRRSLLWIFLVPILTTMVIGFSVFAIYADQVERNNRIADIDAELVRAQQPTPDRPSSANRSDSEILESVEEVSPIQLRIDADGSVITTAPSGNPFPLEVIDDLLTLEGFDTVSEENYRVLVNSEPRQERSITALSLDQFDDATNRFRRALALGGGIIFVLVAAVVWLLARSLTQPLTQIARSATQIADGELDTVLDAPTRSRELSELTTDLNRMLARLKSTLRESERSAADATQARDDMQRFLADMAHELRTPLTALKGYSDLYAGGMLESTDDVDRAMSRIGSESERLHRLADDMLQLARHGSSNDPTEIVDVGTIASAVSADLKAAVQDRVITLHVGTDDHRVRGSAARIHQAILNLGANACDHTGPGDEVSIRVESAEGAVFVRVIDSGPGVQLEDRDRIFLPFYRADTSRTRNGKSGAGLGLALTQQIAIRHRGSVAVEPTPGGGATFVLTLPAYRA